ncbi:MAG TPA: flavodoxin domain-containing protein [Candidatus Limnocylindrales bacterium]|nr:flavodoxin domain-containing protein [Candidatus Limnocylindrales bacterium]
MRALVVYESMFGNTKAVALAIADGIRPTKEVDSFEVSEVHATLPFDVDLLVVGGPTHAHGLTSSKTRADASERAGIRLVSRGSGIREWLDALLPGGTEVAATAFDTRIKGPELLWGSAAKGAAKRLKTLGFRVLTPTSFVIGGPAGDPFDRVSDDEIRRARNWGHTLAMAVDGAPVGTSR